MSQYVTLDYYKNTFKGTVLADNEVSQYLVLASEKIDDVTFNRIVDIGFDELTTFQQECIQKAVCYQAEYYFEYGTSASIGKVSSFNVLDISISTSRELETEAEKARMDEMAYMYVKKSGLTNRRVRWHFL